MRQTVAAIVAVIGAVWATHASAQVADRAKQGDWYISDTTDNNTGEREVYAMQINFERDSLVSLKLKCWKGKPAFVVEWDDLSFPDQTVLTVGPSATPDSEPDEHQYVFEKVTETIGRGLYASPEASAKIISAIGQAKYATFTAHLVAGPQTVGMRVEGTPQAWSRVVRHCPVGRVPVPPM